MITLVLFFFLFEAHSLAPKHILYLVSYLAESIAIIIWYKVCKPFETLLHCKKKFSIYKIYYVII